VLGQTPPTNPRLCPNPSLSRQSELASVRIDIIWRTADIDLKNPVYCAHREKSLLCNTSLLRWGRRTTHHPHKQLKSYLSLSDKVMGKSLEVIRLANQVRVWFIFKVTRSCAPPQEAYYRLHLSTHIAYNKSGFASDTPRGGGVFIPEYLCRRCGVLTSRKQD